MKGVFYSVVTVMLLVPLLLLAYAKNESYLNTQEDGKFAFQAITVASVYENVETRTLESLNMTWSESNITFVSNQTDLSDILATIENRTENEFENNGIGVNLEVEDFEAGTVLFNEDRTFFRTNHNCNLLIDTVEEGSIGSDCLGGKRGNVTYRHTSIPYGAEDCTIKITNFTAHKDIEIDVKFNTLGYIAVKMGHGNVTFFAPGSPPKISIEVESDYASKRGKLR